MTKLISFFLLSVLLSSSSVLAQEKPNVNDNDRVFTVKLSENDSDLLSELTQVRHTTVLNTETPNTVVLVSTTDASSFVKRKLDAIVTDSDITEISGSEYKLH